MVVPRAFLAVLSNLWFPKWGVCIGMCFYAFSCISAQELIFKTLSVFMTGNL